jgi:hypothetical protein
VKVRVLWATLCKCIYSQAALAFLARSSVAGLGSQRVKVSPILNSISSSARKILNGDFIVLYDWDST